MRPQPISTIRFLFVIVALVAVSLGMASCAVLNKPYPEKNQYFLDIRLPDRPAASPAGHSLQVSRVRVSPQSEKKEFLYRVSDAGFKQDFYNEFLVSPGEMFTDIFRNAMERTGMFGAVTSGGSNILPDFILEGSVVSLYGDYRKTDSPQAVLTVRMFLVDNRIAPPRMIWQMDFPRSEPMDAETPQALVAGWNRALTGILAESAKEIESLNLSRRP